MYGEVMDETLSLEWCLRWEEECEGVDSGGGFEWESDRGGTFCSSVSGGYSDEQAIRKSRRVATHWALTTGARLKENFRFMAGRRQKLAGRKG